MSKKEQMDGRTDGQEIYKELYIRMAEPVVFQNIRHYLHVSFMTRIDTHIDTGDIIGKNSCIDTGDTGI